MGRDKMRGRERLRDYEVQKDFGNYMTGGDNQDFTGDSDFLREERRMLDDRDRDYYERARVRPNERLRNEGPYGGRSGMYGRNEDYEYTRDRGTGEYRPGRWRARDYGAESYWERGEHHGREHRGYEPYEEHQQRSHHHNNAQYGDYEDHPRARPQRYGDEQYGGRNRDFGRQRFTSDDEEGYGRARPEDTGFGIGAGPGRGRR